MTEEYDDAEFQQWLESVEGRKCLDLSILKNESGLEYLIRRLWLAWRAAKGQ